MAETDKVMEEVQAVTDVYQPLAHACATSYFVLEQLADVHFLYRFTIQFYLLMLTHILHENAAKVSRSCRVFFATR